MNAASPRPSRDQRAAQIAQVRAEQARAERRRRTVWISAGAVAVLAVVVPSAIVLVNAGSQKAAVQDAAASPIAGEQDVEVPSATHVTGDVDYATAAPTVQSTEPVGVLPPSGGDHDPVVQNCGPYAEPVRDENAVHSLEHGAVWIAYRPDLAADEVGALTDLTTAHPYLIVSPYPDLAAPVVATAWGVQLELDSVEDERLAAFVTRYEQGPQTPEPGAPCSGGVGAA
jgi:hypothetical protein